METTSSMVKIKTPDGEMSGFLARPTADGKYPAVLVIMEAFGLNDHIKDVADAHRRARATSPWRRTCTTAQPNAVVGYDQLPEAIRLMTQPARRHDRRDIAAAVAYLQAQTVRPRRPHRHHRLLHGRPHQLPQPPARFPRSRRRRRSTAAASAASSTAPTASPARCCCSSATRIRSFPTKRSTRSRRTLADLNKTAEVKVYAGAPHGFFCNERDSYRADAAKDAWERLTTFFARAPQVVSDARRSRWRRRTPGAGSCSPVSTRRRPCRPSTRNLGLGAAQLRDHIGWDIGAAAVTEELSRQLGAPAVLSAASRLLVDCNRDLGDHDLMPHGEPRRRRFPATLASTPPTATRRLRRFYEPYHAAVDRDARRRVPTRCC